MSTCRLLFDCAPETASWADGAFHMAVDDVLLQSAATDGLSTLRFYVWRPATLSLGYFQRLADRDSHVASRPCNLVRRASGGGAIVHDHELTYSLAAPTRARFGDEQDLYTALHESLIETLRARFSVQASLCDQGDRVCPEAFLCFQRRASGDVLLQGTKIAGSAQRRRKHAVLQHGSILLRKSRYAPELLGLSELAGTDIGPAMLAKSWLPNMESILNLSPQSSQLTDLELGQVAEVRASKFANPAWTRRR